MNDEVQSFALKSTLTEIQNICPGVKNCFMFKEDGEIITGEDDSSKKVNEHFVDTFGGMLEKADAIGGFDRVTLECSNGRMDVSRMDDFYLVAVTSQKADVDHMNTVTRVLIPTVLKILKKIHPASLKSVPSAPGIEIEDKIVNEDVEPAEEFTAEPVTEESEEPLEPEPVLPEPPINQLIVENLSGLFISSDTVRIDSKILAEWETLYEGRRIDEAEIETFDGKVTQCKVKPIKDLKYEGKGMIRMPEKMQLALEIKKGELVRAKPIIE